MRLACENCAAVYLIDDAAMTPRGVRAQCPRCKNVQYIAPPPDVARPADPVTRAREMANPISVSRPPVPGREPEPERSQVARMTLNTRMVARPPAPPPEALATEGHEAHAELFGELAWHEGEGDPVDPGGAPVPASAVPLATPATAAPPSPPAPPPSAVSPSPGASPSTSGAPGPAPRGLEPSGFTPEEIFGPAAGEEPPVAGAGEATTDRPGGGGTCASCDGPLATLDDVASGVCTPCRDAAAARFAPPVTAPVPSPLLAEPEVAPVRSVPSRRTPPVPSWIPAPAPARRVSPFVVALAAVVLLGLGALLWLRARGAAPLPAAALRRLSAGRTDPASPLPTGLAERLAAWAAANPGPAPSPKEALVEAQRELALDQPLAYASAERRLRSALVVAPRDPELLGAWLTAAALGRGATMDPAEARALVELGESALVSSRRAPAVLVGLAGLLLARPGAGTEERARALAQEALAVEGPHVVEARLVLARTYVRTSAGLALAELANAEQLDPSQRRISLLRAEANSVNGDPRAALAALQARLALEPDHAASLFATGNLLVDVGESDQARRLFERLQADPRTQDGPALLALAALQGQVQGRPREAMQLLRAALKRDRLTPAARVQANVLLASVARQAGDAEASAAAARAALALDAAASGAHLALLLLALDRGDGAGAAEQLPGVLGRLGDPGLEGLIEGRVRMAQGQPAAAAEVFQRTVRADPRRTDALLWAAAAYASVPDRAQALAAVGIAEQTDPTRAGPWSPLSTESVRPEESLRGSEGRLPQLSHGAADAGPLLGEVVLRFHRRDLSGAEAALARVLRSDEPQPTALAWRALLLLERGDAKGAAAAAALALQSGRSLPMVQYAAGVAALAAGDLEGARRSLREVVQSAPGLLAAQVKLADLEVRAGAVQAARERLRKVVQIDPSYASAKRALYLLPKEN